jgi:hypothetical protein
MNLNLNWCSQIVAQIYIEKTVLSTKVVLFI